jgi:hypothetical protein
MRRQCPKPKAWKCRGGIGFFFGDSFLLLSLGSKDNSNPSVYTFGSSSGWGVCGLGLLTMPLAAVWQRTFINRMSTVGNRYKFECFLFQQFPLISRAVSSIFIYQSYSSAYQPCLTLKVRSLRLTARIYKFTIHW